MRPWFITVSALISSFGYPVIFLMIFLESLPLIGVAIPGGTFGVLGAAIFSRLGFFNPLNAFLICFSATLSIDILGYFVGRRVSKKKFHKWVSYLFIKEELIKKINHLAHGHTGKAIILGRLNPPTRAIVPFVIGNEKVKFQKFLLYAMVSALIWVGIFFTIGYLLANSLQAINSLTRLITWAVIILIIGIYLCYVIRNTYLKNKKGGF